MWKKIDFKVWFIKTIWCDCDIYNFRQVQL